VADVTVAVRLAWPHLADNPRDYAQRMEATFRGVLDSVHGGIGLPEPRIGETIRRPTK
jgi:hypothetical protein